MFLRPRSPRFTVTAKGAARDEDHLSEFAWPFFAIYGLLLLGAGVAAYRYVAEPGVRQLMFFVGLWNVFNLVTAGVALGAVAERRRRDAHPRLPIERRGVLCSTASSSLSPSRRSPPAAAAARRRRSRTPRARRREDAGGTSVHRLLRRRRSTDRACRSASMTSRPTDACHARFGACSRSDYFALADLMYGDAAALERFLAARRKHKGIVAGTVQFLWWGVDRADARLRLSARRAPATSAARAAALRRSFEPSSRSASCRIRSDRRGRRRRPAPPRISDKV